MEGGGLSEGSAFWACFGGFAAHLRARTTNRSYAWLSVVFHLPVKKSEQQTDPHGEEKKKTEITMFVLKIN